MNNVTITRGKGKANTNVSLADSRHKNDTLPPPYTNLTASIRANYNNNNSNMYSANTTPP